MLTQTLNVNEHAKSMHNYAGNALVADITVGAAQARKEIM